jgi:hypothetical protein
MARLGVPQKYFPIKSDVTSTVSPLKSNSRIFGDHLIVSDSVTRFLSVDHSGTALLSFVITEILALK